MTIEEAKDIFSEYHTGEVIDYDYAIELVAKYCNKKEPIDEKNLDELAVKQYPIEENDYCSYSDIRTSTFQEIKRMAYKRGYRSAFNNNAIEE